MTYALLVALATLGQVGGQPRYEPGRLYQAPNGVYLLADAGGTVYSSPDQVWLRQYVAQMNANRRPQAPADKTPNYGIDMGSLKATAPESMRTNDQDFGDSFYGSKQHGEQVPLPEKGPPAAKRDWIQYGLLAVIVALIVFYQHPRKASDQ
ncbi:hypothetical protein [Singulisphaera sp. PoT]|uniref:hypothetical protein n=1 Tax=Singulisphaera sp. PoT TaxID=3411797 RepID=UPI003BF545CD